jgi:hypothetical protein
MRNRTRTRRPYNPAFGIWLVSEEQAIIFNIIWHTGRSDTLYSSLLPCTLDSYERCVVRGEKQNQWVSKPRSTSDKQFNNTAQSNISWAHDRYYIHTAIWRHSFSYDLHSQLPAVHTYTRSYSGYRYIAQIRLVHMYGYHYYIGVPKCFTQPLHMRIK